MEVLIAGCLIVSVGLYVSITGGKKEKFTRRINNQQPIMDTTTDEHTWQRTKSYYRDHPLEYNYLNTKEPEERPDKKKDFRHTNEVPFFKKEPYYVYDHEMSPFLDRYMGDKPKKETIAPLYDKGRTHFFNKNEIQLERVREQEEMDLYKNNFNSYNSKNFEYVGGDPVRVGPGIGNGYSADPQGGFQDLWRQKELDYEELKGETRPDFDDAIRVPGLQGHNNLTVDEWAGEQTRNAKPATAFRNSENQLNVQPGRFKKPMERPDKIVMKLAKTINSPAYPYTGPALGSKYGQDLEDNVNNQIQPKPVKYDIAAQHKGVNHYHPTSNPLYYERKDPEAYWNDVDKAKVLEQYANYKLVDTKVQRHIYKDYDDYDWNDMKTGNEFVCVARGGVISATRNDGTTVEAQQQLSVDTSEQHRNQRETYVHDRQTQQQDIHNNNLYMNVSERTKNDKHANKYRENNRSGNIDTQNNGRQGGYSVINQNLRKAYKTNAFMDYKGNAGNVGNNNSNSNREYMKTMNVNESKNTISSELENRSHNGRKQKYHNNVTQERETKQRLSAYTNIKNNVFSGHSRQGVNDNRNEQMKSINNVRPKNKGTTARNDFNIRRHTLAL